MVGEVARQHFCVNSLPRFTSLTNRVHPGAQTKHPFALLLDRPHMNSEALKALLNHLRFVARDQWTSKSETVWILAAAVLAGSGMGIDQPGLSVIWKPFSASDDRRIRTKIPAYEVELVFGLLMVLDNPEFVRMRLRPAGVHESWRSIPALLAYHYKDMTLGLRNELCRAAGLGRRCAVAAKRLILPPPLGGQKGPLWYIICEWLGTGR